jgi:hypothetical protein
MKTKRPLDLSKKIGESLEADMGARRNANTCESSRRSLQKYEEHSIKPNLVQPAPVIHLNDLHSQSTKKETFAIPMTSDYSICTLLTALLSILTTLFL